MSNNADLVHRPMQQGVQFDAPTSLNPQPSQPKQDAPDGRIDVSSSKNAATDSAEKPMKKLSAMERKVEPVKWSKSPGNPRTPGTLAYYKSRAFIEKKAQGLIHVPGVKWGEIPVYEPSKGKRKEGSNSLVLIFGKNNVRRARVRKVDTRMQRYNRRM